MPLRLVLETFLNGVLVRAREGSKDQFSSVWVPGVNGKVIALSDNINNILNVAEFDVGVDPLRIIVQGEIDEVDVPCAFPVSKEAAFYAVCSSKNTKLSSGNASPCV
jgi:hypothetical protein